MARPVLAVAGLVGIIAGATALGRSLPSPPLTGGTSAWSTWFDGRGAAGAVMALLRWAVLAMGWYLLATIVAGMAARASRLAGAVRALDLVTLPSVRRMLAAAAGISLSAAALAPGMALADPRPAPSPREVVTPSSPGPPEGGLDRAPSTPPTMHRIDPVGPSAAPPPSGSPTSGAAGSAGTPSATGPATPTGTPGVPEGWSSWTARPGDSFWLIAERVLTERWGRRPSDPEIDGYWRSVVAANTRHLADPDNPDLIFPGQTFDLPPTPPAS